MALKDSEKNEILFYLGWPLKALIPDSTHYHKTIADRMVDLTDEVEVIVRRLLQQLKKVDKDLEEARCRLTAERVDNIVMQKDEIRCLLKERKRYRNELHRTLDIPVLTNDGGGSVNVIY